MIANRPPVVSKTTVTQIASKDLPADTFARFRADFAKQEMPSGGPLGGGRSRRRRSRPNKSLFSDPK
jgi:hypothetical protein